MIEIIMKALMDNVIRVTLDTNTQCYSGLVIYHPETDDYNVQFNIFKISDIQEIIVLPSFIKIRLKESWEPSNKA